MATAAAPKVDFQKAFESVKSRAEEIKNDERQVISPAISPGQGVRQGDVYICFEGEKLDGKLFTIKNAKEELVPVKKMEKQLVPGNTQGSRHCLSSLDGVTMYTRKNATVLDGPILVVEQEVDITHPEHGDWCLFPGVWSIGGQRAFADELRRQQD